MNSIIQIVNKVSTVSCVEFYGIVAKILSNQEKMFIVTANPEIVMNGRSDDVINGILCNKATVIPDGIGVAKAVQLLKAQVVERNTGIELVQFLLEEANKKRYRIFIYGSKQSVLDDFIRISEEQWPGAVNAGIFNGYDHSNEDILNLIEKSNADIYLVALGSPKQELFINQFFERIDHGICVGVGGTFDVLSGHTKRASSLLIKYNLEWLYRITTQPKRFDRFVKRNVWFVYVLLKELISQKLNRKL